MLTRHYDVLPRKHPCCAQSLWRNFSAQQVTMRYFFRNCFCLSFGAIFPETGGWILTGAWIYTSWYLLFAPSSEGKLRLLDALELSTRNVGSDSVRVIVSAGELRLFPTIRFSTKILSTQLDRYIQKRLLLLFVDSRCWLKLSLCKRCNACTYVLCLRLLNHCRGAINYLPFGR